MASTVHVVLLSLLFITIASPKCTFTTVTARCECDSYLEVYEKVLLIEIESERCNCTIKLMNSKSIPEVTNVFNRECQWVCTNDTCIPNQTLPTPMTSLKTTTTKPITTIMRPTKTTARLTTMKPTTTTVRAITRRTTMRPTTTTIPTTGRPTTTRRTRRPTTVSKTKTITTVMTADVTDFMSSITGTETKTAAKTMTDLKSIVTGLWIWVALSSLITMVVIIKLFMQLRWHNRQYLPLHRTFNTTTESQPISNVQSSYLTISSSHPSDAVIHNILPVTPPPSSTPEKSDTTLLPPLFFNDRDPSPEPSAPPMEIELELQSPASSPVATRTRSQSKRKIMFKEAKL